jgi:RNase P subunit RPR2
MQLFRARKQQCPVCETVLNAATNPFDDGHPEPGDITVCVVCRTVLVFGEAMDFRLATAEEISEVVPELVEIAHQLSKKYSITTTPDGECITCHQCGKTSYNMNDIKNGYCGHCHEFI